MEKQNAQTAEEVADTGTAAMFFVANTYDAINWDKLREKLREAPPALTEQEYCNLLVAAANGKKLTGMQWNQLVGAQIQKGGDELKLALPAPARDALVDQLKTIVNGSRAEIANLANTFAGIATESVLVQPVFSAKRGRRDRVVAYGMRGALAYGIWLLLDPKRPFRDELCRCQYSACGIFFFKRRAVGRGAPGHAYCCTEHAKAGNNEKSRLRMARIRAS